MYVNTCSYPFDLNGENVVLKAAISSQFKKNIAFNTSLIPSTIKVIAIVKYILPGMAQR